MFYDMTMQIDTKQETLIKIIDITRQMKEMKLQLDMLKSLVIDELSEGKLVVEGHGAIVVVNEVKGKVLNRVALRKLLESHGLKEPKKTSTRAKHMKVQPNV